jgi:hypothetical protein
VDDIVLTENEIDELKKSMSEVQKCQTETVVISDDDTISDSEDLEPRPPAEEKTLVFDALCPRTCSYCGTLSTPMWGHGPGEYVNLCDSCGLNWRRGKILQNAEYRQHLYKPAQKKPLGIPEHHQNSSIIPTSSEIYEDDHQASTTTEILCYEPHQNSSSTSKGSSDCYELVSGEDLTGLYNVNGATYTKSEEHLNEIETRHSITHQTSSIPQLVSEDFP